MKSNYLKNCNETAFLFRQITLNQKNIHKHEF